jgi:hypothetical protein
VTFLFILFSLIPVIALKRPESCLFALLAINLMDPYKINRLFTGRPYLMTSAAILVMMCLWQKLSEKKIRYGVVIILVIFIAASTWIHGGWYFLCFPIVAFFMARQWRAGILITLITIIGVSIGLMLTGHPMMSVMQTVKHILSAFNGYQHQRVLVIELRPFAGDLPAVVFVLFILMWRGLRGEWDRRSVDNPVFMLIALSWVLSFLTRRIWADIGISALFLWIAQEFQDFFAKTMPFISWKRPLITALVSVILFFALTSDFDNRWSGNSNLRVRLDFDTPETASWAPGPGGIVYNNDMDIFYDMFYKNPKAPWRYMVGYEAGIMPPEDLATYRNIQLRFAPASFTPWVKKMRPEDRLIIYDTKNKVATKIKEFEWYDAGDSLWIGRLNENNQ